MTDATATLADDRTDQDDQQDLHQLAGEPGALGEEPDGQVFVLERGDMVTLGTLIGRGTPVQYEFKMDGKSVKGARGMSLISFDSPDVVLVVPARAGKVVADPTYDVDGGVVKVTVRAHVKPTMVYDADSVEGQAALTGH